LPTVLDLINTQTAFANNHVENNGRNTSLTWRSRSSPAISISDAALPIQLAEQWLQAIYEYKDLLDEMLQNLRDFLVSTYRVYQPIATEKQWQAFLATKVLRENLINTWIERRASDKAAFWEQYRTRFENFDTLKQDLQEVGNLADLASSGKDTNMIVIAARGDTILEFKNNGPMNSPALRFRVSSRIMAEASPFFDYIFNPTQKVMVPAQRVRNPALDMISDLPPPPTLSTCTDGMEVKVYQMPQLELNEHDALTILFHAAHMHHKDVPKDIAFPVFVSVAEVCRYV
jgi:hypothetical protein